MSLAVVAILALVTLQRLAELLWSRSNERRLRAKGAYEVGAGHYPLIVALHAAWLVGLWLLAWDRPVDPWFLALYLVLQAGRAWVLVTLGRRWTARILVAPGEQLIETGPYRFARHPNYVVVVAEIACLPLVFGLWWYALVFSVLNAGVLWVRIRAEDAALATLRPDRPRDRSRRP